MKPISRRLPSAIMSALEATGRPFRVEDHGKGIRLFLEQKQVGKFNPNKSATRDKTVPNIVSQIRRAARQGLPN